MCKPVGALVSPWKATVYEIVEPATVNTALPFPVVALAVGRSFAPVNDGAKNPCGATMISPVIPECSVHTYANVPAVGNVRVTSTLTEFGMFVGAPAVENVTLCVSVDISHVTFAPTPTVVLAGVKRRPVVAAIVAVVGLGVGAVTVTVAVPVEVTPSFVSDVVMTAAPGAIPVTVPLALTIAAVGVADVKVNPVVPVIATPFASRAVAVSAVEPPIGTEGVAEVTAIVANACATTKLTLDVAVPLVAVIVAEPLPVDVAVALVPVLATLSTAALLDEKVTVGLASAVPLASFTIAVITRVSPIDTNDPVLAGVSVMLAATGIVVAPESLLLHADALIATRAKMTLLTARRIRAPIGGWSWYIESTALGTAAAAISFPASARRESCIEPNRLPLPRFRM